MTEEPAKRLSQATGIPFASRPADIRSNQKGRYMSCWMSFLAGPHDLDGAIGMLGDFERARDAIDLQAPTESTPDQMIVHDDFVQR